VRARECIPGVLQVIELGIEPAVQRVAAGAICGEPKTDVIEDGCFEILLMARIAIGGKPDELPDGRLLVALFALHHGVRADQGETVGVVPDGLKRNLPALHRVALRAVGAELAAMDIGVTIGARRPDVLEHHAGVALSAGHVLVHAAQRIASQIMVEFGIGADRLPTLVTVAICARG
jgi:hypothetical protein